MNLNEQWDEMPKEVVEALAVAVFEAAAEVFEICGAETDFCVQSVDASGAVFGSTNRVLWRPGSGFRPDRSYCTERFLREWDAHDGRP